MTRAGKCRDLDTVYPLTWQGPDLSHHSRNSLPGAGAASRAEDAASHPADSPNCLAPRATRASDTAPGSPRARFFSGSRTFARSSSHRAASSVASDMKLGSVSTVIACFLTNSKQAVFSFLASPAADPEI